MGLMDWLPWRRAEKRNITLADFKALGLTDTPTAAGIPVTERTALNLAAYWAGVNLISSAVAKLPRKVYRKVGDDREEVADHPVARILQVAPNDFMVPLVFWRTLMAHVLTWGNGYAEIEWSRSLVPIGLWIVTPDKIEPKIEGDRLVYRYNGSQLIPSEDMFHIPGLGFDGLRGYSVVQMARQSIGLGLAAERYGAAFFGNGAMPGLVLEHPATLSKPAQERLRASWNDMHQGPDKAHRLAILEEGMKANPLSIPARDAQLIETREVQVLEVARWLNINPAMLGYKTAERPGGNYESNRLDYLDNTLDPWLVAIEQECNRKLISKGQQGTYYAEHTRNAVLRTDAKTRALVQKTYVDMGALSPERVAQMENFPRPEPKPPAPVVPPPAVPPAPEPQVQTNSRQSLAAERAVIVDAAARFVRREGERVRKASKRGASGFAAWCAEHERAEAMLLRGMLVPPVRLTLSLRGLETLDAEDVADGFARRYLARSREELLSLSAKTLEQDAELLVARWGTDRPGEVADAVLAFMADELRSDRKELNQ